MKVVLYMAMSVDGYIALDDDSTPWSDTGWEAYIFKVNDVGCLILGRRTYEIMKADGFEIFEGLKRIIVVGSSNIEDQLVVSVSSPEQALERAQNEGYQEVIVGGGTKLNQAMLKAGFIDRIELDVEPMLLGSGIRFFAESLPIIKLRTLRTEQLDEGVIHIEYEVVK